MSRYVALTPPCAYAHAYRTRKCMHCACTVELLSHTRAYTRTYMRTRTSTAPPRIPDVTTLAHLARRTLEMSPPPLLLLLYSSLSLSSSLRRRRSPTCSPPPSPRQFPLFPPFVAAVYCSVRERLPVSPDTPPSHWLPPLLNRALFTLVIPATAERGAARSCILLATCVFRARRRTRVSAHSPTRIFARAPRRCVIANRGVCPISRCLSSVATVDDKDNKVPVS